MDTFQQSYCHFEKAIYWMRGGKILYGWNYIETLLMKQAKTAVREALQKKVEDVEDR